MDPRNAKLPPQNQEAEASLLGAILIDSDAIVRIADLITHEDFYDERHGHIYSSLKSLYDKHSPIDVLTLANELRNNGLLDTVGGASYLTELTNFVPSAAHVMQYAEIVSSKSMRRKLIKASQDITNLGYDETETLQSLVEQAEARLFEVSNKQVKQDIVSIEQVLSDSFERLDELHKDKGTIRGVPT